MDYRRCRNSENSLATGALSCTGRLRTLRLLQVTTTSLRETTRGSAIAEEPRDALRQLKYYGRF